MQISHQRDDAIATTIAGTIDGIRCQKNVNIMRSFYFKQQFIRIDICSFQFRIRVYTVYTDTVTLQDDSSIMTYRGHRVKKTLIRAKFSPQETTGQRYIYTGCGTGRLIGTYSAVSFLFRWQNVIRSIAFRYSSSSSSLSHSSFSAVYDVLTGKIVYSVRGHKDIVRDVAWHPSRNEILTSSWDYNVNLNFRGQKKKLPLKRSLKDVNQDDPCGNDDENADSAAPPPRRSRRLALRRQAQQSN